MGRPGCRSRRPQERRAPAAYTLAAPRREVAGLDGMVQTGIAMRHRRGGGRSPGPSLALGRCRFPLVTNGRGRAVGCPAMRQPGTSPDRTLVTAAVVAAIGWIGIVAIGIQLASTSSATLGFDFQLLLAGGPRRRGGSVPDTTRACSPAGPPRPPSSSIRTRRRSRRRSRWSAWLPNRWPSCCGTASRSSACMVVADQLRRRLAPDRSRRRVPGDLRSRGAVDAAVRRRAVVRQLRRVLPAPVRDDAARGHRWLRFADECSPAWRSRSRR